MERVALILETERERAVRRWTGRVFVFFNKIHVIVV